MVVLVVVVVVVVLVVVIVVVLVAVLAVVVLVMVVVVVAVMEVIVVVLVVVAVVVIMIVAAPDTGLMCSILKSYLSLVNLLYLTRCLYANIKSGVEYLFISKISNCNISNIFEQTQALI